VIVPAPQPVTGAAVPASPQQLGQLLCSVAAASQSSSSRAQLVPLLNQVLVTLGQ
jgi:hypothetical protein